MMTSRRRRRASRRSGAGQLDRAEHATNLDANEDGAYEQHRDSESGQTRTEEPRAREFAGTGIVVGVVVALVLAMTALAFIAQNGRRVTVDWLWLDFQLSIAVIALGGILLGVLADEALGLWWRYRRRTSLRRDRELEALRRRVSAEP
jgi:uncharacterized integral membrane protein